METFSLLSDLDYDLLDDPSNIENIKVYQLQANNNKNIAVIREVGKVKILSNILINKFLLKPNFNCTIVSCIYDLRILEELIKLAIFPMMKIIIYENVKIIAEISLNFCYVNLNASININQILSREENINLEGIFEIKFKINNQFYLLEKINKYLGNEIMINKLMEHLLSENVMLILLSNCS
ncbi:Hypothetical protein KVN_LOCUS157 [uncultured virus]|nr:Hypothetical protein KVN_LOCUS157 [uncultured virus]